MYVPHQDWQVRLWFALTSEMIAREVDPKVAPFMGVHKEDLCGNSHLLIEKARTLD
jgi:hypothetical protein